MTALVDSCAPWLIDRARSVHSQFGEDGLIEAVFEKIGIRNEWCFEVGAADGVELSNTKIWRDRGWRAVLIERDDRLYDRLEALTSKKVKTVCAKVDAHNFEDILDFHGAPHDLDLGVIDIDGQDYWLWSGLSRFRPRVMLIEFSPYVADSMFVPDVGEDGRGGMRQAGLSAMRQLGKRLGYIEVAKTYCNILFVLDGEL